MVSVTNPVIIAIFAKIANTFINFFILLVVLIVNNKICNSLYIRMLGGFKPYSALRKKRPFKPYNLFDFCLNALIRIFIVVSHIDA